MLNLSSVANWLGEKLEDKDGFVPKTMLCLPIYNGQRDVIGVAQLINKVGLPSLYKPLVRDTTALEPWGFDPCSG